MIGSARASREPVRVVEHGLLDYAQAWAIQRGHAHARAEGTEPDTLMLLEHPAVYTAGRRTTDAERPADGTPVIDVDRGGKITWHGPGQLVGYPITGLAQPMDVVDYVRRLEQALITVCDTMGVVTGRVDGRSGVWLAAGDGRPERKIAAIGVRVQRGVTLHGFALNCNPDLSGFDSIIPCGIVDAGVSSLSVELGRDVTTTEVREVVTVCILDALDGRLPVTDRALVREPVSVPGLHLHLAVPSAG
ncbi:MAG: lipoyl(octanoyl) transferase LipB [Actinomycetota bacterium]|nr:lipoyl(octanoyl) transferase LipB [Actinomycetota bacterium]